MKRNDPRGEDGGYGASNLVGSNESGLRSAMEGRRALDAARADESPRSDDAKRADADLGRLAGEGRAGGPRAGTPMLDDVIEGTSQAAVPRDARGDSDRLEG